MNVNQGHQQQRVFVKTLCSFTRILIAWILHRESTQELVQNEKFNGPMRVRLAPSVECTLGTSTILVFFPVEGQFQAQDRLRQKPKRRRERALCESPQYIGHHSARFHRRVRNWWSY